ncbi:MAG: BlaI/MecI/CopY family transcriptional regulator [Clostridiales bacterium]|jgi:predicted transcriptional regulator|nr:BlaI/MecI/CopY family transcriptional regulator [Clostridiales bacterium]
MDDCKLYDGEFKFISIIWDAEPVNSTELVRLCADKLGWKKSTTYTMLKRLAERGLVQNVSATVTTLVKREQVRQYEAEALLKKMFDGSVPSFVASFLHDRKLTEADALEIERMIRGAIE